MLVAMDDFTKLTEIVPLKNMTHREMIEFITEYIIHKFGIPQSFTADQGLHLYQRRCMHLQNHIGLSCSIHLHIMLRPMVRLSQVTRFWSNLSRRR